MKTEKEEIRKITKDFANICLRENLNSIKDLQAKAGYTFQGSQGKIEIENSNLHGGQSVRVRYLLEQETPITIELNNHRANFTTFIIHADYLIPGYNPLSMRIKKDITKYTQSRTIQNSTDFATCLKELERLHQI